MKKIPKKTGYEAFNKFFRIVKHLEKSQPGLFKPNGFTDLPTAVYEEIHLGKSRVRMSKKAEQIIMHFLGIFAEFINRRIK